MLNIRGFTIIELLLVMAVIGTLVALTLPAYRDYAIRARITECITLLDEAKGIVLGNAYTNTNLSSGLENTLITKNCQRASLLAGGVISITSTDVAGAINIQLHPSTFLEPGNTTSAVVWTCKTNEESYNRVPVTCRNPL